MFCSVILLYFLHQDFSTLLICLVIPRQVLTTTLPRRLSVIQPFPSPLSLPYSAASLHIFLEKRNLISTADTPQGTKLTAFHSSHQRQRHVAFDFPNHIPACLDNAR